MMLATVATSPAITDTKRDTPFVDEGYRREGKVV
jgi:hypothetical protein